jgi:hypothetical protein
VSSIGLAGLERGLDARQKGRVLAQVDILAGREYMRYKLQDRMKKKS